MSLQTRIAALISAIGADMKAKASLVPRTRVQASTATLTPNFDAYDMEQVTAQTGALNIANPTGTLANGRRMTLKITDDGTARALSWGTAYRSATGAPLPTTTTAGKTHRLLFEYDSVDAKLDLIATSTET